MLAVLLAAALLPLAGGQQGNGGNQGQGNQGQGNGNQAPAAAPLLAVGLGLLLARRRR